MRILNKSRLAGKEEQLLKNIKYRAWYEDSFDGIWKMANVRDIIWNCGVVAIDVFTDDNRLFYQPLNFKLMQSTGHRDIKRTKEHPKGQEIYAGDLVRVSSGKYIRIIEWSEDEASFKARMLPNETENIRPLYMNEEDFEVLGNIHENPDLL